MCVEIYQFLKILLREKGFSTAVGDEGGFAPDLKDSEEVLRMIVEAVEKAGYEPGKDIFIAIDAAASELYDEELGVYRFPGESKMKDREILCCLHHFVPFKHSRANRLCPKGCVFFCLQYKFFRFLAQEVCCFIFYRYCFLKNSSSKSAKNLLKVSA